jgi:voltage-gated potassium channel
MFRIIHQAFHASETRIYRVVEALIWVMIAVSLGLLFVDLAGYEVPVLLDRTILWGFAVEYILRVASFRPPLLDVFNDKTVVRLRVQLLSRLRYALRPLNIVDLLTVLALVPALRALRALRLLRLFRGIKFFRYASPLSALQRSFTDNALIYAFAFAAVGIQVGLGGLSMYLAEHSVNPGVETIADGMWWAIVTLTTVGFGDISPMTTSGRAIASVIMIGGMFTLALFAGIVGQSMLHVFLSLQREQFRMQSNVNHVVVCGYENSARTLLDILEQEVPGHHEVVLFAPHERPEGLPPRFTWVRGDPTKESELDKVRLAHAMAVVVVGTRTRQPQEADAISILTVFTVRSWLNRQKETAQRRQPLHIVAEILDSENVAHARTAGADEVVETHRLSFSLLSHAVIAPGTASALSSIAGPEHQNVFTMPPTATQIGQTFGEISREIREAHGCMVIGYRTADGPQLNPADSHVVPADSELLYLSGKSVQGASR